MGICKTPSPEIRAHAICKVADIVWENQLKVIELRAWCVCQVWQYEL